MSAPATPAGSFRALAERVADRLQLVDALCALERSAVYLFPIAGLGLGLLWLAGAALPALSFAALLWWGGALVALWGVAGFAWARWRRLSEQSALAYWDRERNTQELFLSAASLEGDSRAAAGAALHVQHARAQLGSALAEVGPRIPVRPRPTLWLAPALWLLLCALGWPADARVTQAVPGVGERALDVARSMEDEAGALEQAAEPLTEQERKELERIQEQLSSAAERMRESGADKTPRQVLEELERQAHLAEQLARKLDAGQERVSSALLAELERHPDTAEMAGALRAGKLEDAAKEAQNLALRLKNANLSVEAQQRIQNAFSSALTVASAEDLRTLLGRHIGAAQGHLEKDANSQAGAELEALAESWRQMSRRMRSMEMLKRMAEHLREAGQQALGRTEQGLKQLGELDRAATVSVGQQTTPLSQTAPLRGYQQMQRHPPAPQPPGSTGANAGNPVPGTAPQGPPHHCPQCGQPRAGSPGSGATPGSGAPNGAPARWHLKRQRRGRNLKRFRPRLPRAGERIFSQCGHGVFPHWSQRWAGSRHRPRRHAWRAHDAPRSHARGDRGSPGYGQRSK